MKRTTIFVSIIIFIIISAMFYILAQTISAYRLKTETEMAKEYFLSAVEMSVPEIITAFNKSDDIAMLYNIEKIAHVSGASEAFVINKNSDVIIHNDSSKWNKKYTGQISDNILSSKEVKIQNIHVSSSLVYSIPINADNFLCVIFSVENIKSAVKSFTTMLYVIFGLISVVLYFIIYALLKFFFLKPYNKTVKMLSLNRPDIKTVYKNIIDMAVKNVAGNTVSNDDNSKVESAKKLFSCIYENILTQYENFDVFAVIDAYAKVVVCLDDNNKVFKKDAENKHIINAISNTEVIKQISAIIENKSNNNVTVALANGQDAQIIPLIDSENNLLGMAITVIANK